MAKFLDHEAVHFVAGRIFPHGGQIVYPGEVVEDAREWKNLESLVRSRYLLAVAEDPSVLPVGMRKDVKPVEHVRRKLNADSYLDAIQLRDGMAEPEVEPETQTEETTTFSPDMTIKDLLGYLDEHPQDIKDVLQMERTNQNRPRLVKKLEARLAVPNEEEIDV